MIDQKFVTYKIINYTKNIEKKKLAINRKKKMGQHIT